MLEATGIYTYVYVYVYMGCFAMSMLWMQLSA